MQRKSFEKRASYPSVALRSERFDRIKTHLRPDFRYVHNLDIQLVCQKSISKLETAAHAD